MKTWFGQKIFIKLSPRITLDFIFFRLSSTEGGFGQWIWFGSIPTSDTEQRVLNKNQDLFSDNIKEISHTNVCAAECTERSTENVSSLEETNFCNLELMQFHFPSPSHFSLKLTRT